MKKYRLSFLLLPITYLLDILILSLSFLLGHYTKFFTLDISKPYITLFWILNLAWIVAILLFKPTHQSRFSFNISVIVYNYIKTTLLFLAFVAVFWVFNKSYYSRGVLAYTIFYLMVFGTIWRILGVLALKAYRSLGYNNRYYAIVGYGDLAQQIRHYFDNSPELGFRFTEYFEDHKSTMGISDLLKKCELGKIDVIYCCLPYINNETVALISKFSETLPVEVKLLTDFRGFLQKGASVEYHGHLPVLALSRNPYTDYRVEIFKRIFDITFSSLAIVILLPVLFFLILITKFSSKGPIFYTQERIGRWGKPFKIIKFRSMYINAEASGPALSTGSIDPRITPWGKFMRKTRLDELPQFLNVLKGDMSIVGPRPERQFFIDQITEIAPEYIKLLTVRPGITSLGQIHYGYASSVNEMVQRMKYDLLYLKKYSFETDIVLIFQTAKVMVQGRGK